MLMYSSEPDLQELDLTPYASQAFDPFSHVQPFPNKSVSETLNQQFLYNLLGKCFMTLST